EAAGSPETAAHILAEELVNYPEVDTLSFRLGALYLAIGDTTAAYTHLDPLLLKRPYMMVVARMMAELDPKTVGGATSGENADGGYNRGRSGAELSFILVLAGLTALVLLGGGLLVRRKLAERRHLAGFSVGDEDESAAEEKITEPTPVLAPTTEPEETQTAGATIGEENSNYVRDKEVYRLADKKKGTAEIAETLGISQDEVRLILQMRHQEDTPATVMEESLTTEAPEA
nr:hypothetical protein [bacterium]